MRKPWQLAGRDDTRRRIGPGYFDGLAGLELKRPGRQGHREVTEEEQSQRPERHPSMHGAMLAGFPPADNSLRFQEEEPVTHRAPLPGYV